MTANCTYCVSNCINCYALKCVNLVQYSSLRIFVIIVKKVKFFQLRHRTLSSIAVYATHLQMQTRKCNRTKKRQNEIAQNNLGTDRVATLGEPHS